jgi:hypothetical protein
MSKVIAGFSMSLDGFVADSDDGVDEVFGRYSAGGTDAVVMISGEATQMSHYPRCHALVRQPRWRLQRGVSLWRGFGYVWCARLALLPAEVTRSPRREKFRTAPNE